MSYENKGNNTWQRNYCAKLCRKEKKIFFANLDTKNNVNIFWQTAKLVFSDKTLDSDQITLINNDETISDDETIAKTFNDFFSKVVKNLNLNVDENLLSQNLDFIEDPVLRAIKLYGNQPSIKGIERNVKRRNFPLSIATFTDIKQ